MKKNGIGELLFIALGIGSILSFIYVRPYDTAPYNGQISFSTLLLQFSGRRGDFELGTSMLDLLSYYMRTIPYLFACCNLGLELYHHYCTASVVVFSRITNRTRWFLGESGKLLAKVLIFQLVLLVGETIPPLFIWKVSFDNLFLPTLCIHYTLYALWFFAFVLLTNILSVFLSSEGGLTCSIIVHSLCIAVLALAQKEFFNSLVRFNPIANLVLDWHFCSLSSLDLLFCNSVFGMSLGWSFIYLAVLDLVLLLIGLEVVNKHDLLADTAEQGGL